MKKMIFVALMLMVLATQKMNAQFFYYPPYAGYIAGQMMAEQLNEQLKNSVDWKAVFDSPAPTVVDPSYVPSTQYDITTDSSESTSTSSTTSSSSSKRFCTRCSNTKKCPQCRGTGMRTDDMFGTGVSPTVKCGICGGSGKCPYC